MWYALFYFLFDFNVQYKYIDYTETIWRKDLI